MKNKQQEILDTIRQNNIDILVITESWIRKDIDDHIITAACPSTHTWKSSPRVGRRGGGIVFIYDRRFSHVTFQTIQRESYEAARLVLHNQPTSIDIVDLYRPPRSSHSKFINEFQDEVFTQSLKKAPFIFIGDFNFNFHSLTTPVNKIKKVINENDLVQHITDATHESGNTIDWVVAPVNGNHVVKTEVIDFAISDHKALCVELNLKKPSFSKKESCHQRHKDD